MTTPAGERQRAEGSALCPSFDSAPSLLSLCHEPVPCELQLSSVDLSTGVECESPVTGEDPDIVRRVVRCRRLLRLLQDSGEVGHGIRFCRAAGVSVPGRSQSIKKTSVETPVWTARSSTRFTRAARWRRDGIDLSSTTRRSPRPPSLVARLEILSVSC